MSVPESAEARRGRWGEGLVAAEMENVAGETTAGRVDLIIRKEPSPITCDTDAMGRMKLEIIELKFSASGWTDNPHHDADAR